MNFQGRWKEFVVLCITLVVAGLFLSLGTNMSPVYLYLTEESQGVEILTAIFYIIAGFILILSTVILRKRSEPKYILILPILLGLFFIFIGGEEESWGQWIFGFSTPEELKTINYQEEVTVHNLTIFAGIFHAHFILNMFVVAYGILTPLLYVLSLKVKWILDKINCPVIPVYLAPSFVIALMYEKIARVMTGNSYVDELWRHTEVMEFMFSTIFMVFAFIYTRRNTGNV